MTLGEQIEVIKGLSDSLSLTDILADKMNEEDIAKLVTLFETIQDMDIPVLVNIENLGKS
ncbi:MAG: hypothetical protein QF732_03645 [Nitrospinaceae bacterium]|nr:hypothetical protein [Nitrospinaceae bacterium]